MEPLGLYIHIPFCNNRCSYCNFYTQTQENAKDSYVNAVLSAISKAPYGKRTVDSVYFGGGTPTTLGANDLCRMLDAAGAAFQLDSAAEITVEANPESATTKNLRDLVSGGFTRISFGVQSLDDRELAALGRIHHHTTAITAIEAAACAGFGHISADLMLGTPFQTLDSLERSIDTLAKLPLDHISAYLLSVEDGTPLAASPLRKDCADEDLLADCYLEMVRRMEVAGFLQYEVSNFAKPGGHSRHNLKYWQLTPYLGIGPSAHSFLDGRRFYFEPDLAAFIGSNGSWAAIADEGAGGGWEEYSMLRLRLVSGLNLDDLAGRFPKIATGQIKSRAETFARQQLVTLSGNTICFTPQGFLISTALTAELLYGENT